jgi:hypothetical protein
MRKRAPMRQGDGQPNSAGKSKQNSPPDSPRGRRKFLGQIGGAATALSVPSLFSAAPQAASAPQVEAASRADSAYQYRVDTALAQKNLPPQPHLTNGDDDRYANRIASFTKSLPHNRLGEVELGAYLSLLRAVQTGAPEDFERVPLGGAARLVNPQSGLSFELIGHDAQHVAMPPAPAFSSAEQAGEMVELYWQALTRDVNFSDYETNALTNAAAADLSRLADFRGPRPLGRTGRDDGQARGTVTGGSGRGDDLGRRSRVITPEVLFRGNSPGELTGPYISQFLWLDVPYGAQTISQRMRTALPGEDYLTNYDEWLEVQRGAARSLTRFDPVRRYIRNNRDLGEWVRIDILFQAYFNALLILQGMRAPMDAGGPYRTSRNQVGFATFGPPHIQAMVCGAATCALKAVWYTKWFVHRRLRPETFAGRVHNHLTRAAEYPIHPDVLNSAAAQAVFRKHGTYLLPTAYPEGAPIHPSYAAGHAGVAGACVTILKAWFDESWVIPNPVVPSADGLSLQPYYGPELTLGGELNKVAANVGIGRNAAGVHYRSDHWESVKLGEAVAIGILADYKRSFNERFDGFSLTKFDGTKITI